MKSIGELAQEVTARADDARRDNVVTGPWPSLEEREAREAEQDALIRTEFANLSAAIVRCCNKSGQVMPATWVRAAVAQVLSEIDKELDRSA